MEALKLTITGGGDCDTNAAIVGGIVSLSTGQNGIPEEWQREKEKFPKSLQTRSH
jgi:ADP-ribosylglycohydrolase